MTETRGVVYSVFGKEAQEACAQSLASLRKTNPNLNAVVVGDTPMFKYGVRRIHWPADVPAFKIKRNKPPSFRSGIVKPHLFHLSPFDLTLYLDADTDIRGDLTPGFDAMKEFDIAIAAHVHPVEWYRSTRGFAKRQEELDETIAEWGGGKDLYWNSGVIFWRRNEAISKLFRLWHEEWMRWPVWNEQLALMRAAKITKGLRVNMLDRIIWNTNHPKSGTVIFHNYGKGIAWKK
jgi:hypothetical protein